MRLVIGIGAMMVAACSRGHQDVSPALEAPLSPDASQLSLEEIEVSLAAYSSELQQATKEYYDLAFQRGAYEVLFLQKNEQGAFPMPLPDDDLTCSRLLPSGELRTVRLPRAGFEHVYAIREEMYSLMDQKARLIVQRQE